MKKYFILLAAAAMLLPMASSCKKDPKPGEGDEPVVMEAPKTASVAKAISFEAVSDASKPMYDVGGKTYKILSLDLTESSRFILRREPVTKADNSTVEVLIGSFTESGGTYTLSGFGTVSVNGTSVTVTPTGSQAQNVQGASVSNSSVSGTTQTNANRNWKPDNCIVTIKGSGVNINKSFTGCNLYEIASYAKTNGVNKINAEELRAYNLQEVIFTNGKTIAFNFSGTAYYGSYMLSGENLTYRLESGNDLINAVGSGTVTFPASRKAVLTLNADVQGYTGSIEINFTESN